MNLTFKLAAPALVPLLLGTLASCGGSTPSDDLFITDPVLTSGYVDNLNRPLICDNRTTPMEFGFLYGGDLQRVQVSLVGDRTRFRNFSTLRKKIVQNALYSRNAR